MPINPNEAKVSVNQYTEATYEAMKEIVGAPDAARVLGGYVALECDPTIKPGDRFETYVQRSGEYVPGHEPRLAELAPGKVAVKVVTEIETTSQTTERLRQLAHQAVKDNMPRPVSYAYSQAPITATIAPVTPAQAQPRAEVVRQAAPAPAPAPRPTPKPAKRQKSRSIFGGLTGGSGSVSSLQTNGGDKWDRSR